VYTSKPLLDLIEDFDLVERLWRETFPLTCVEEDSIQKAVQLMHACPRCLEFEAYLDKMTKEDIRKQVTEENCMWQEARIPRSVG
jgi:hypothetical protein